MSEKKSTKVYTSELRLTFGDEPLTSEAPAAKFTVDTPDSIKLVVDHFIKSFELDHLSMYQIAEGQFSGTWIHLIAQGEIFTQQLSSPDWPDIQDIKQTAAEKRLADFLEEWVCETEFAWGEHRTIDTIIE